MKRETPRRITVTVAPDGTVKVVIEPPPELSLARIETLMLECRD